MSGTDSELKQILLRDIIEDKKKVGRLKDQLAIIEPRLSQSTRYYRARFGEEPFQDAASSSSELAREREVVRPPRRRVTHADFAAVALTQSGMVGTLVKINDVLRVLREAGYVPENGGDFPTRETMVSTVYRSPLFQRTGPGEFVLRNPYGPTKRIMDGLPGIAGGTRAQDSPAGDGPEAMPDDDSDIL